MGEASEWGMEIRRVQGRAEPEQGRHQGLRLQGPKRTSSFFQRGWEKRSEPTKL